MEKRFHNEWETDIGGVISEWRWDHEPCRLQAHFEIFEREKRQFHWFASFPLKSPVESRVTFHLPGPRPTDNSGHWSVTFHTGSDPRLRINANADVPFSDNAAIKPLHFFASAKRAPTRRSKMAVASSSCTIYCLSKPNPGGSAPQRGFMSCVVASFPAGSVCQYFCSKRWPECHKQAVYCGTFWGGNKQVHH